MARQDQQLAAALEKLRPDVRRAFERAIRDAVVSIDSRTLAALIDAGRIEEALELVRMDRSLFAPLTEVMRVAFISGGQLAERIAPKGLSGVFRFDGRQRRAIEWVEREAATLVQGIENDGIATARKVIASGLEEGQHSRTIARSITGRMVGKRRVGGFLGLTEQLTDSIISGRAKLASGNPALMREYLSLKLRDKTFDKTIRAAIEAGKPIRGAALDRIMEAHRSKALGYRGRVIAGHETKNALASGRHEGMTQMLDRDDVDRITVRWQHNMSVEPRLEHLAMNGTVIDLGETFVFPGGVEMQHPHDADAPARHTIGCRCTGVYRVKLKRD